MYHCFFLLSPLSRSLCLTQMHIQGKHTNTTPFFRDSNKHRSSESYSTDLQQKAERPQGVEYKSRSSTKEKYWCYHSRLNQDKWLYSPRADKEEATLLSAQTHIVQTPSHAQEEVHLHWMVHYPSLHVTRQQRPRKTPRLSWKYLCDTVPGELHGTNDCLGRRAGGCRTTAWSLTCSPLSVRAEGRSAQFCHFSLLTRGAFFPRSLYAKQETRGEGFGPNLRTGIHHAAWWGTRLYKLSITSSTGQVRHPYGWTCILSRSHMLCLQTTAGAASSPGGMDFPCLSSQQPI